LAVKIGKNCRFATLAFSSNSFLPKKGGNPVSGVCHGIAGISSHLDVVISILLPFLSRVEYLLRLQTNTESFTFQKLAVALEPAKRVFSTIVAGGFLYLTGLFQ